MPGMQNAEPTFEIGLVMAGAVSAGAYTAGVLDFLLQALDAWQDAKDAQHPDAPPHNVLIKVLSGASAGGILAGILATLVNRGVQPVTQAPDAPGKLNNKLYECWVERIDIARMLEARDLQSPDAPLKSLLDVTVLDEIADFIFHDDGKYKYRPYFDKSLHVLLSVTNLRGVPYSIYFQGDNHKGHELSLHADYMHFLVSGQGGEDSDAIRLDPYARNAPDWQVLRQSALASSAFPGGLAPRLLRRRLSDYGKRAWYVPMTPDTLINGKHQCRVPVEIPPRWPPRYQQGQVRDYEFLCVDGGLMNNEPLELARRILAGDGQSNPRDGRKADRAMIMIDPFPDPAPFSADYAPDEGLLSVLLEMFTSLKYQARFKPEELKLAMREDVFSRFLIAPSRRDRDGKPLDPTLACASLGAFGGFLSKQFRQHDFFLGRRNCQQFLLRHFALPEKNRLFDSWRDAMRKKYRITNRRGETFLPVIPVLDEVREEIPMPAWPSYSRRDLAELEKGLARRGDLIVGHLLPKQWVWRILGKTLWHLSVRRKALRRMQDIVVGDLQNRDLFRP